MYKKQYSNTNKESTSCLNGDFFDYYDTRLDFIKWNPSGRRQRVRCIGKKKEKDNPFKYNHQVQIEDVLCNPKNPVNPDSKPRLHVPQTSNTPSNIREIP
jgi:hypothetical protein